jgi:A/G-specific adenine glycosylase
MTETAPIDGALGARLLAWYDRAARVLPWRAPSGTRQDPYRVWLSEMMLQQTTVAAVGPYFRRFLSRWPDIAALAAAPREEVLREWAGLGYYARARNLHDCARRVVAEHGGRFPTTVPELRALPGIGPYTAGAIAAIAFDAREVAVDGNVERVVSRLAAITTPLPQAKAGIRALAGAMMPTVRPGDFAQAMMDLGATVCTPRGPSCPACPLRDVCRAAASGEAERYPVKLAKPPRPLRRGVAFVLRDAAGAVWLTRRPPTGLLGGMVQVPTTAWSEAGPDGAARRAACPAPELDWRALPDPVRHVFTHFELDLAVVTACMAEAGMPDGEGRWCPAEDVSGAGLPSLFRKVVGAALEAAGDGAARRRRGTRLSRR